MLAGSTKCRSLRCARLRLAPVGMTRLKKVARHRRNAGPATRCALLLDRDDKANAGPLLRSATPGSGRDDNSYVLTHCHPERDRRSDRVEEPEVELVCPSLLRDRSKWGSSI